MATTDKDKDFLVMLDKIITSNISEYQFAELTSEQKSILEMSEKDMKDGKVISQEAMDKRNLEWLNFL